MKQLQEFKNWLSLNGIAKTTISGYSNKIKFFLINIKNQELNYNNICKYLYNLQQENLPQTYNVHLHAINKYLEFKQLNIKLPKPLKTMETMPSFFTYEYLRDTIIPIAESIDNNPLRNKALFYFMFFTGIRRSEINSLKRKHFDLENRKVKIIGHKGKKERIVIIHKKIVGYIETFFASIPEKSNAFNCKTASLYRLLKLIQPYCKEVHLHPHCFRHSFAIHFLKRTKGQGIFALSKLLGHVSIETTMKYLKSINCDDIKKMFDEFM